MKGKYTYRIINTVITAAGTLLCIVSGFIPAPYGLLSDGTISLIQSLTGSRKAWMFLVPVLLFIAATVIVAAGRYRLGALIAVLAGSCIFALTDLAYIRSSMAFTGTLLNEFGIVIALSGVLLHAFGTPTSESPKNEGLLKTLDPFLEAEPGAVPGAEVRSTQIGLQEAPEPETRSSQSGLQEAPEPESEAEMPVIRTGLPEELGITDEQQENSSPAGDPMTYTQVLQPVEAEPEEMVEEEGNPMTYTQVLQPAEPESEELIAEDGDPIEDVTEKETEEAALEEVQEAAPLENTIVLDADLEDLLIDADRQEN